jgi:hypothetical protein
MGTIGHQHPGKAKGLRLGDDIPKALNEIVPVLII